MICAFDLGSTSFKAAIFNSNAGIIGNASIPVPYNRSGQAVELDVNVARGLLKQLCTEALRSGEITAQKITAVGVTSQAQTFTLMDDRGQILLPLRSWLDGRGAAASLLMTEEEEFKNFKQHAGVSDLQPALQVCQLRALLDNENEEPLRKVLVKRNKDLSDKFCSAGMMCLESNVRVVPLPGLLMYDLTGVLATDENLASLTGLYSLIEKNWWSTALNYLNLSIEQMPVLFPCGSVTGFTRAGNEYGFPQSIPVYSCGNDQTAGAFGAQIEPGDTLITLGTALVVYRVFTELPHPRAGLFRGLYPGSLFYGMSAAPGGERISAAISADENLRDFETFDALAVKELGSGTSKQHCFPSGVHSLTAPQIKNKNPGAEALGVLHTLAETAFAMAGSLPVSGKPKRLLLAGGGVRMKSWVTIINNISPAVVIESTPLDGTAEMIFSQMKS